MSTSLLQREALRAPAVTARFRSSYPCGPTVGAAWHARICAGLVLSDRIARMPKLTFAPEVNA